MFQTIPLLNFSFFFETILYCIIKREEIHSQNINKIFIIEKFHFIGVKSHSVLNNMDIILFFRWNFNPRNLKKKNEQIKHLIFLRLIISVYKVQKVSQVKIRTPWFVTPTVFYDSKPSLPVCVCVCVCINMSTCTRYQKSFMFN